MAIPNTQRPYSQFNFRVDLQTTSPGPGDFFAGFQEVSGLGAEIHVAEYRAGNSISNSTQKITGTTKINDITLKRGVVGDLATLYDWWNNVRSGRQDQGRTVTIQLLDEQRNGPVQSWVLKEARPTKYTGPALTGKGTDVAIEELVLVAEDMELQ